jgi:exo-beta-1,3-glucanase (GH17 family)
MTDMKTLLNVPTLLNLPKGNAICYSGYREGQSPNDRSYPSSDEILEDLLILQKNWQLLRLYDCSLHAERVLQVIEANRLPFQVMLGAYLGAEMNNFGCPWGGTFTEEQLEASTRENEAEVGRLIALANRYPAIVFSVAVGNEATVDWTDHFVPVHRMIDHVRRVKSAVRQPVTFCENYVPWQHKLSDLVAELDFISLHTYPVWEYKHIHEALDYTKDNLASVARLYPGKPIVITEAGWCTNSNGRGMHADHAVQELQAIYYQDLMDWTRAEGLLCFVFEAFDEPWKGSPDPLEPEKHWGLFTVDRKPKLVVRSLYPELALENTA